VYLSAYAHNDKLLVKEGAIVKAGQKVATLGSTGTQSNKLYFEIRCNGKPVDLFRFLPKR
jgi:lipoprotein NlpD